MPSIFTLGSCTTTLGLDILTQSITPWANSLSNSGLLRTLIDMFIYVALTWLRAAPTYFFYYSIRDSKSTSIALLPWALFISYFLVIISLFLVGILMKFKIYYFLFMIIPILQLLVFQVKKLNTNQSIDCLSKFKSNNFLGLIVLINILIGKLI